MDYCTLYIADPSLIGSKTFDHFIEIKSYTSKSDRDVATGMRITLEQATIDCNFKISSELEEHLSGLRGFVCSNSLSGIDVDYILGRIAAVSLAQGCVISPGFDDHSKVLDFIKSYANFIRCMFFYDNALWDYDGECLASL